MAKRLALLLLFVSALPGTQASESAGDLRPYLSHEDAKNPEAVVAWLKENGSKADKKSAQGAYEYGQLKKSRKEWGAAAKAFGESRGFYPTPRALNEYAGARLHMLGELKPRNKPSPEDQRRHLAAAEGVYRSALAADSVLKQLTAQERQQTRQNAECLGEYLKSSKPPPACPPLEMYGIKS